MEEVIFGINLTHAYTNYIVSRPNNYEDIVRRNKEYPIVHKYISDEPYRPYISIMNTIHTSIWNSYSLEDYLDRKERFIFSSLYDVSYYSDPARRVFNERVVSRVLFSYTSVRNSIVFTPGYAYLIEGDIGQISKYDFILECKPVNFLFTLMVKEEYIKYYKLGIDKDSYVDGLEYWVNPVAKDHMNMEVFETNAKYYGVPIVYRDPNKVLERVFIKPKQTPTLRNITTAKVLKFMEDKRDRLRGIDGEKTALRTGNTKIHYQDSDIRVPEASILF